MVRHFLPWQTHASQKSQMAPCTHTHTHTHTHTRRFPRVVEFLPIYHHSQSSDKVGSMLHNTVPRLGEALCLSCHSKQRESRKMVGVPHTHHNVHRLAASATTGRNSRKLCSSVVWATVATAGTHTICTHHTTDNSWIYIPFTFVTFL